MTIDSGIRPGAGRRIEDVNILTVTKLRWWPFQRLGFVIGRRSLWAAEHLVRHRGLALQLKRLNFLHEGRWVAFGRFPRAGLGWRERESFFRRWVLFCANFNQGWSPYFLAFLDSFGSGINTLWGDSADMPDYPLHDTRYETIRWVNGHLVESQHYYAAYPEASTNDVRMALRVTREFEARDGRVPLDEGSYRRLPAALRRSLQPCLYEINPGPPGRATDEQSKGDAHVGLVTCVPIRPGCETELKAVLRGLPPDEGSPFARVGGIHFARFVVLDRGRPAPEERQRLKNSWLVLAVVFDAWVSQHLASGQRGDRVVDLMLRRDLQIPCLPRWVVDDVANRLYRGFGAEDVGKIWELCRRPLVKDDKEPIELFRDIIWDGRVRNLLVFADYPDTTVPGVRRALDVHRSVVRGAADVAGIQL